MKALVVIPARYGSTRLSAKVLLKETGKYLMQHTYDRVLKCSLVDRVIIATDDKRVLKAGQSFGAEVKLTSKYHTCGTERIAEVARYLPYRYIINVQADEPEIDPEAVDKIIKTLQLNRDIDIATLAVLLRRKDVPDPNKVKVLLDSKNNALSFQRSISLYGISKYSHQDTKAQGILSVLVPSWQKCGINLNTVKGKYRYYRHLGIYGYKKDALLKFVKLPQTESEKELRLEQLRALENGFRIKVVVTKNAFYGIDTAGDYKTFVKRYKSESVGHR
ncbi:MAG: 3-deoxy-manno-octulosonate cytidylyltransferase [Planctomycetota bacterium]